MGLVAQLCNQARLDLKATQAANQHDASVPQYQPKMASDWVSEQQPAANTIEDTPEFGGVGPTTQHEICIKPTAAVSINTAADQEGAECGGAP